MCSKERRTPTLNVREQLRQLRRDYSQRALSEKDLPTEPFDLLKRWLQDALSEGLVEPNAAALATVSKDG
ncbi:MAG: hypothetical protein NZ937_09150, partial [Armatimonadetes bacterium]|nr:hypothetical protein [Armatimonadota bacterium]